MRIRFFGQVQERCGFVAADVAQPEGDWTVVHCLDDGNIALELLVFVEHASGGDALKLGAIQADAIRLHLYGL